MRLTRSAALSAVRWLVQRHVKPAWPAIVFMTAVTVAGNLLTVLQPAVLAGLLANLSTGEADGGGAGAALDLNQVGSRITGLVSRWFGAADPLIVLGFAFVVVSVLMAVATYFAEAAAARVKLLITRRIQIDLLSHLLAQDMTFFNGQKTGELMSRVTLDAGTTANAVGPLLRAILQPTIQLVAYSLYLFSTSLTLTVGALILIAAQFGVTQLLRRPTRRFARLETDVAAELMSSLQETFFSVRVAKSFGAERFELAKLGATIARVGDTLLRKAHIEKLENPLRAILDALAVLGIFIIAIVQMRRGDLTFQGLLLFTYVGRLLIAPINAIATNALWIQTLGASFERIQQLLAQQPVVKDGDQRIAGFERSIQIDRASFSYGERQALVDLTLEIRKGEFIALVGPSGAGKSTLSDLILRLYDPESGELRIDGVDLRRLRQSEYRRLFGVVSQESLLFNDTVRNNIRYGRDELADADIVEAARAAHAHEFIMALPQGYDSFVGDRGLRLSGGERQRIAIARALVHKPAILILDEATSALDSESERQVQLAINEIVSRTTAIVIAHRLSTVTHADRIVVLNEGRIESVGTHTSLLETSPTYRTFCALQFRQPPVAAAAGAVGGANL